MHVLLRKHATLAAGGLLFFAVLGQIHSASAQEWTRFRGPNGTGHGDATGLPAEWSESDYNWKITLPGVGHSSPVLWGDRMFITSAIEDTAQRIVMCINAQTGEMLWERRYDSSVHVKHLRNSFASCTPAVDDERLYFCWSTPEEYTLVALTHDGQDAWQRNLGPYVSQHSSGVSPIVYEDMVILSNDQDGESFLIAVDRRTGETRWQTPRTSDRVSYATPCVLAREGLPDQLIFECGAHGVSGIDPKTGQTAWELKVFSQRTVASPVIAGGLIIGICGSGAGGNYVVAVRPGGPDGTAPEEAWKLTDASPYVPTPIVHDDLVYLWSDKGIVTCVRAADGSVVWRERIGGNFSGSPILVDGKIYCISEEGEVVVLAASDKYELLGRNPLGDPSRATPSVAGGKLFLRTYSQLFSLGGKKS
jgi:outer membrane protein assembly factor BamB